MFLSVTFALLSAALNALAAIWQRRATGQVAPHDLFRGRLVKAVVRNRIWLAGVSLNVAGFFAQALALHSGSLTLVQPLLTTDIVFLLLFLHFGPAPVRVNRQAFIGAASIMAGLSVLLVVARPHGGTRTPAVLPWLAAAIVVTLLIIVGSLVMRRTSKSRLRAGIGGATAGLHFAFTAAWTKLVIDQLQYGVWHTLFSWQLLGLFIVGVSSVITMQSMYGAGSLAITQPALEITEALAGIAMGILLFGDTVNDSAWALAAQSVSGLLAAIGIVLLSSSGSLRRRS